MLQTLSANAAQDALESLRKWLAGKVGSPKAPVMFGILLAASRCLTRLVIPWKLPDRSNTALGSHLRLCRVLQLEHDRGDRLPKGIV